MRRYRIMVELDTFEITVSAKNKTKAKKGAKTWEK